MRFFNRAPSLPRQNTWYPSGQAQYLTYGMAYQRNEIVFAAIEMLATSAGEPMIVGKRWKRNSPTIRNEQMRLASKGMKRGDISRKMIDNGFYEDLPSHPLVRLLNNPNPFMSRGQVWGTVVMDRSLAGNAYLLKSRYQDGPFKGKVAELWRLRPDRVKVIPSAANYIEGFEYNVGTDKVVFPREDVLHFKTRDPLNDYYGMPPLMPLTQTVDIEDYMRRFLRTFFERGGAAGPGSILAVKGRMPQEAKDEIRERFRARFGQTPGELLVLDNAESTYTQMGLNRGLRDALPREISNANGALIASVFGIPGSLLGLPIAYDTGNSYANKRQDWQVFWDLTMTPMLSDFDDVLNLSLVPEFGAIDEVCFDLANIRALQEDVDLIQKRHRDNWLSGMEFWEEARENIGYDPNGEGTLLIPSNMVPVYVSRGGKIELPEPEPVQAEPVNDTPTAMLTEVRHSCKDGRRRLIARDVIGNPELWCEDCKTRFRPIEEQPKVVSIDVVRDGEGRVAKLVGATE